MDRKIVTVGLCGPGRHEINDENGEPITQFIFEGNVKKPLDFLGHIQHTTDFLTSVQGDYTAAMVLYVTGLTPVLTSFLQVWDWTQNLIEDEGGNPSQLILMHYDRDSGSYVPQHY